MRGNGPFKLVDRWVGVPLVWTLGLVSKLGPGPSDGPLGEGDSLLVVKLSALGDSLLLLPLLKALKDRVGKRGRIVAVVTAINEAAFQDCPWIDQLIVVDFGTLAKKPFLIRGLMNRLRRERARMALDFDQWLRISPLLCFLSGAPLRFGFKTRGQHRHFLYQRSAPNGRGKHESQQFAEVASLAGLDPAAIEGYPGFLKRERLFALAPAPRAEKNERPLVHFHPGCGVHGWQRAWPVDHYVRLAQKLHHELKASIRLTGMGEYEENLARQIQQRSGVDMENLCGPLGLARLADLVDEADLVVCGNMGIMHLAVGLGKPLVALHGPTDPVKWGPGPARSFALVERNPAAPFGEDWAEIQGDKDSKVRVLRSDLPCSPCLTLGFEYGCPGRPCMESIEADVVFRECRIALGLPVKEGKDPQRSAV
jgi:heptosyltransferase III